MTILFASVVLGLVSCAAEPTAAPFDIALVKESTTPFQLTILEDGVVTAAEYESAVLAHRSCVENAGASPGEIESLGHNQRGFQVEIIADTEEEAARIDSLAEACHGEYLSDVADVWVYQQLLSEKELDAIRPDVASCLRDVGIKVSDTFTMKELYTQLERLANTSALQPCMDRYPEFFVQSPRQDSTPGRAR
ncbi:hypothetical protein D9V32_12590 [Mycetocola tolaasinivorans]|uniref:DUF732 domain-containing protein n=1 Tax=Mycetocola tolaasinivorans TaxID=76635 RepID=A0A3L7A2I5_9MICO|nr:hypothetical protein [Mycetocola tolaasinivorans]RLP74523.1 hypothetical protein D9V32_12590 [Mycetocola tolaasinivorans]